MYEFHVLSNVLLVKLKVNFFLDNKVLCILLSVSLVAQIINLLQPEELLTILPRSLVSPRCVVMKPGQVLFVAGMGRIDFVQVGVQETSVLSPT